MNRSPIAIYALAALVAAPGVASAQNYGQPTSSGNPLSSIFSCQAEGNKQAGGAAVGAVLGGLIANSGASKRKRGRDTVLGAALGAAAGSYIGCRMQTSDQQRAQAAAQLALDRGESTTWNNPQTGASGRINVVSSQGYGPAPQGRDDRRDERPVSLNGLRFATGVQPQYSYTGASGQYEATNRVNLRGRPSADAPIVGTVERRDSIDAIARVRGQGEDWLLAGRNGVAIGYVAESLMRPASPPANAGGYGDGGRDRRDNGPVCRTFDQTITTGGGQPETQRYTACQTASGEWVVQG